MILEADTVTIINTIEVLNSSNDRFCGIVMVDDDSQGYARSSLGSFVEQQLEGYRFPGSLSCHAVTCFGEKFGDFHRVSGEP